MTHDTDPVCCRCGNKLREAVSAARYNQSLMGDLRIAVREACEDEGWAVDPGKRNTIAFAAARCVLDHFAGLSCDCLQRKAQERDELLAAIRAEIQTDGTETYWLRDDPGPTVGRLVDVVRQVEGGEHG